MRIMAFGVGAAVLALAVALPGVASAQVQATAETQLAQRAAQSPHDISSLLDLAKLYFEQRRFEEASRTLSRAMAVIQQEQLVVVPAARPTASAKPFAPLSSLERSQVLRVGGDVQEPKRLKYVEPIYPPVALSAKVEGYVILEAVVGPDGHVRDLTVLKPHPLFNDAAFDAVRQWEYTPPTQNGVPVSVVMNVTVLFKLK